MAVGRGRSRGSPLGDCGPARHLGETSYASFCTLRPRPSCRRATKSAEDLGLTRNAPLRAGRNSAMRGGARRAGAVRSCPAGGKAAERATWIRIRFAGQTDAGSPPCLASEDADLHHTASAEARVPADPGARGRSPAGSASSSSAKLSVRTQRGSAAARRATRKFFEPSTTLGSSTAISPRSSPDSKPAPAPRAVRRGTTVSGEPAASCRRSPDGVALGAAAHRGGRCRTALSANVVDLRGGPQRELAVRTNRQAPALRTVRPRGLGSQAARLNRRCSGSVAWLAGLAAQLADHRARALWLRRRWGCRLRGHDFILRRDDERYHPGDDLGEQK
jgi:hypothetical protein